MGDESTESNLRGRDLATLGGILVAGVVGGLVLGLVVDDAAGTSPAATLIGIGVGIAAGIAGSWVRVRAVLRD